MPQGETPIGVNKYIIYHSHLTLIPNLHMSQILLTSSSHPKFGLLIFHNAAALHSVFRFTHCYIETLKTEGICFFETPVSTDKTVRRKTMI
jgi:hypothetical protein